MREQEQKADVRDSNSLQEQDDVIENTRVERLGPHLLLMLQSRTYYSCVVPHAHALGGSLPCLHSRAAPLMLLVKPRLGYAQA
eukprot:scaffold297510_cov43-Tisochrysis_lutea.AAC.1